MNAQEKYQYWLDIAVYDLQTAEAMFKTKRWLYVVFMCQQSIEKLIKGLYCLYIDDDIPRIHDSGKLLHAFETKLPETVPEQEYSFLDRLTSYYIKGRYADYKTKLSVALDKAEAKQILDQTKETFKWLQSLVK